MPRAFAERYPLVDWDKDAKPKPLPWLVDGFWLKHGITAVLGPEKSGKSRFIGYLLARMLAAPEGSPVLMYNKGGIYCGHTGFRKVLYLNAEEETADVMARVNSYARNLGLEPRDDWPIKCVNAAGMQLQTALERREFEAEWLVDREFDFVVLDPLRRVHGGNENDNSQMAPLHNDIRRWTQVFKITWLLVHHTGHLSDEDDLERIATWSRGNTDLPSLLDGATCLRTIGGAKVAGQQLRSCKRMGRFPPLDDLVLVDSGDPAGFAVR